MNSTYFCETSFSSKSNLSKNQKLVLVTFNIISIIVTVASNSLVIVTLKKTNQLSNMSFKLIFILSISDICLASMSQTLFTIMLSGFSDPTNCKFDSFVNFLAIVFTHTSAYIIVMIGFDRFARMKYLNRYASIVTERRIYMTLVVFALLSLVQGSFCPIGTMYSIFGKIRRVSFLIDGIIAGCAVGLYVATIFIVRRHTRNAHNRQLLNDVDHAVTRVASLILLVISIFYIPYILLTLTHSALSDKMSGSAKQNLDFLLFIGYSLGYCNPSANALIFLGVNKKARKFVSKAFCKKERSIASSFSELEA